MTVNQLKRRIDQLMRDFNVDNDIEVVFTKGDEPMSIRDINLLLIKGKVNVNIDLVEHVAV